MEPNFAMDSVLTSIRLLFRPNQEEIVTAHLETKLTEGVFGPIPTLRSLAMQSLVLNNWPVEEFLPGEAGSSGGGKQLREQREWLRLLTKECEGTYRFMSLKDSFVYGDGTEGSEEDKENERAVGLQSDELVEVSRPSTAMWEIGHLCIFQPWGSLRHVNLLEYEDEVVSKKMTVQEWMEGSSLVVHCFYEECDQSEDANKVCREAKSEVDVKKNKLGFDLRISVTFCQDVFIYKERRVNTTKNHSDSYTYSALACFTKE